MKKGDLVRAIAQEVDCTLTDAGNFLDTTISLLIESLRKGDDIVIPGFGSWVVTKRAAREGRNPQTGEVIKIKASKVVRFKPGKTLKDAVSTR